MLAASFNGAAFMFSGFAIDEATWSRHRLDHRKLNTHEAAWVAMGSGVGSKKSLASGGRRRFHDLCL
jgi:hypothetical protein